MEKCKHCEEKKEWKIDTTLKKINYVVVSIASWYFIIMFFVGFILGMLGYY